MKTKLFILLTLAIWVFTSCEEKIDVAKEEAAIKAVFEADKTAYLKQDAAAMAKFWVHEPSSKKIFQSATGENVISGWENINVSQQKEVADTSWDRKLATCTFSDFQINISEESAWVTSKTNWKGTMNDKPFEANQSRIVVMKKVDGKWKFALMAIYNFPMEEKAAANKNAGQQEQIELHKQFIGSWKGEMAKDTTIYWDVKPYGTGGMECYFKSVTKGKTVMEGKQLWAYDKGAGKFTMGEITKGVDNAIYSSWFDSVSVCTMKYFGPASTFGKDTWEWKIEFKNPDIFVETILKNSKPIQTFTMNRVK